MGSYIDPTADPRSEPADGLFVNHGSEDSTVADSTTAAEFIRRAKACLEVAERMPSVKTLGTCWR